LVLPPVGAILVPLVRQALMEVLLLFSFLFTALACSFAAFAYAEFASMVPVSGSAYTYSYVAFGELMLGLLVGH
jgi:amino acid transporter